GELYIGGDGLARGYLHQPELTREKFVPHPFSSVPGHRLYRTGDLVRRRTDGLIEFLGRLDHQIKLRGFRIELGEIEAALSRHPLVAQAIVVLREVRADDKRLVAYLIGRSGTSGPTTTDLRQHLQQMLPEYMVPAAFVVLDAFPLTANGKIDRRALPAPTISRPITAEPAPAPATILEQTISRIISDALGTAEVGLDDNFFDLGGNSLLAVQVQSQLSKVLQIRVPLRNIFQTPHVRGLAEYMSSELSKIRQTEPAPCQINRVPQAVSAQKDVHPERAASLTRRAYRFLALSEHPLARWTRASYHAVRAFSLPTPRLLVQPIRWILISLRFVWHFLIRVLICEPMFKSYCRKVGRNFHTGIYLPWIQGTGDLTLGDSVRIDGKCSITFAARFTANPTLTIGNQTGIGHNCMFTVGKAITIGNRCRIASDVWMFDSGGHPLDPESRELNAPLESDAVRPIEIGDDVWIGRRCVIFPGVTIGKGSVIVPCSVVMSNVPPYSLVSGHPAKVVAELQNTTPAADQAN
ncbi:MAG: AMP-binding protein, partial [Planctomycetes bacterium]|nr:AMP-binding protein [Planctomycetota bacterium]